MDVEAANFTFRAFLDAHAGGLAIPAVLVVVHDNSFTGSGAEAVFPVAFMLPVFPVLQTRDLTFNRRHDARFFPGSENAGRNEREGEGDDDESTASKSHNFSSVLRIKI